MWWKLQFLRLKLLFLCARGKWLSWRLFCIETRIAHLKKELAKYQ
jgi:hypothetical protein